MMENFFLPVQAAEFDILFALQELHCGWLNVVMRIFTELGNSGIVWILTGLVCIFSKKQAVRRFDAAYHVDVSYFGEWCH